MLSVSHHQLRGSVLSAIWSDYQGVWHLLRGLARGGGKTQWFQAFLQDPQALPPLDEGRQKLCLLFIPRSRAGVSRQSSELEPKDQQDSFDHSEDESVNIFEMAPPDSKGRRGSTVILPSGEVFFHLNPHDSGSAKAEEQGL